MTNPVRERMSTEQILAYMDDRPDLHFDIIDGELVEVSPKPFHGRLQANLTILFGLWLRDNPVGVVHTEVNHVLNGEPFIPDISINPSRADDDSYFDTPPLLAVEIRSDTQSRAAQRRKVERYIAHGTPAVLLIMPSEQVELYTSENPDEPAIAAPGQEIDTIPGFPGLTINVAELFD